MMFTYYQITTPKKYTADGAIDVNATIINLAGSSAIAMTLPDPPIGSDGHMMGIVSTTAAAHTVTNTTGFNGGSTASDVATFGGAIGDGMLLVALGGIWHTLGALRNVTLG